MENLDVRFSQVKILKDINVRLLSEGRLQIKKPNVVIWEIEKPAFSRVTLKGGEMRIQSDVGKPEEVFNAKEGGREADRNIRSMMVWLKMDAEEMFREYRVWEVLPRTFRFEPFQKDLVPFQNLTMELSAKGDLKKLKIHEKSGDDLEISFATPRMNFK